VDDKPNPAGKRQKFSPILGLPVDDDPVVKEPGEQLSSQSSTASGLQLSVMVPARNEEQNLPGCLASLLAQSDEFFLLGRDWELLVIDDASTDRTRALAQQAAAPHAGVRVLEAPLLDLRSATRSFTGKTNACWFAAEQSQGAWLLFTDADTLHEPGDLVRALHEAERHSAVLLSYSPRQIVHGVAQHTLMPLIFSELATVYPPKEVNDPGRRIAAANGQFLMVEREAYFAVGGHRAIGKSVLEDVDLAFNIKRSKRTLRFRYAPDALSTRMYRGFGDMVEGWTKNLALLFPHALALAAWRLLDIVLLLLPVLLYLLPYLVLWQRAAIVLLWARTLVRFYNRVARSHFSFVDCACSVFALPLFLWLLVRSWMNLRLFHQVAWKGREYKQ
jgi:glycosyltransferase involved in cell wall biosynthesis